LKYQTILNPVTFAIPWWERYPRRFEQEAALMEEHTNAWHSVQDGYLVWNEAIYNCYDTPFDIAIVHQHRHPFDDPRAFVIFPEIRPSMSYHMFGDGHLCLSMNGELDSATTALTVRNLACLWVSAYEVYMRTGEWITRQH